MKKYILGLATLTSMLNSWRWAHACFEGGRMAQWKGEWRAERLAGAEASDPLERAIHHRLPRSTRGPEILEIE